MRCRETRWIQISQFGGGIMASHENLYVSKTIYSIFCLYILTA